MQQGNGLQAKYVPDLIRKHIGATKLASQPLHRCKHQPREKQMKNGDLIRMANQITDYFEVYPKPEALDGIAKHIHNTWEPRMRNQLKAIIEGGGDGLRPLCAESMRDYFKGANSNGRRVTVNPRDQSPDGAAPSFAEGGGDAG